ncbi:MAG: AraC family transcriptional regulator [Alicyclobacillus mali]|uniref:AraC family transcriptional regulator n=1 Tax=Alicyclobacillus mali (ex Roth et al. 2021) TaxID=1123961 RepID=UPI0023F4A05D|nr:AraC family transcriptional regulator [Alicyclobacillus mali (ex Roth et al. 2021)]MCL6489184.1 AraC family transcriptional regulator [Alicyclobacillus mali (ex Roth et al. 2021)]
MEAVHLLEHRQHGDASFHIQAYHVVLTPGPYQQTVNLHWHSEAEFIVVTRGSVCLQVGSQLHVLGDGGVALLSGGELHSMAAPGKGPSECKAIVFGLDLLESPSGDRVQQSYLAPLASGKLRLPGAIAQDHPIRPHLAARLCEIAEALEEQPVGYELTVKGCLYDVLAQLFRAKLLVEDSPRRELDDRRADTLKAVLTYIDAHLSDKLRLSDLAHVANMSEGHFCRFFKEMTHRKPMQYVNERRVARAADLLKDPNRSITAIGMDLGFHDVSYFIKVFRSYKHCTPLAYRKALLKKPLRS